MGYRWVKKNEMIVSKKKKNVFRTVVYVVPFLWPQTLPASSRRPAVSCTSVSHWAIFNASVYDKVSCLCPKGDTVLRTVKAFASTPFEPTFDLSFRGQHAWMETRARVGAMFMYSECSTTLYRYFTTRVPHGVGSGDLQKLMGRVGTGGFRTKSRVGSGRVGSSQPDQTRPDPSRAEPSRTGPTREYTSDP